MTPILGVCYHLIRRGRYSGFPRVDVFPTPLCQWHFLSAPFLRGSQLQEQLRSYTWFPWAWRNCHVTKSGRKIILFQKESQERAIYSPFLFIR